MNKQKQNQTKAGPQCFYTPSLGLNRNAPEAHDRKYEGKYPAGFYTAGDRGAAAARGILSERTVTGRTLPAYPLDFYKG